MSVSWSSEPIFRPGKQMEGGFSSLQRESQTGDDKVTDNTFTAFYCKRHGRTVHAVLPLSCSKWKKLCEIEWASSSEIKIVSPCDEVTYSYFSSSSRYLNKEMWRSGCLSRYFFCRLFPSGMIVQTQAASQLPETLASKVIHETVLMRVGQVWHNIYF